MERFEFVDHWRVPYLLHQLQSHPTWELVTLTYEKVLKRILDFAQEFNQIVLSAFFDPPELVSLEVEESELREFAPAHSDENFCSICGFIAESIERKMSKLASTLSQYLSSHINKGSSGRPIYLAHRSDIELFEIACFTDQLIENVLVKIQTKLFTCWKFSQNQFIQTIILINKFDNGVKKYTETQWASFDSYNADWGQSKSANGLWDFFSEAANLKRLLIVDLGVVESDASRNVIRGTITFNCCCNLLFFFTLLTYQI